MLEEGEGEGEERRKAGERLLVANITPVSSQLTISRQVPFREQSRTRDCICLHLRHRCLSFC